MSEGLQNGSEMCCDVCFGDGGTDKKTGDRAGDEMSRSERRRRLSSLERKLEKQGSEGLDMCRGGRVDIFDKGC